MKYFKFAALFLLNFIKVNKTKSIAIILAITLLPLINSFDDEKVRIPIYKEMKLDKQWCYIYLKDGDFKMKSFTERQKLYNGNLVEFHFDDRNGFVWFFFVVCLLFIVVPIFTDDSDIEYDIQKVYTKTLSFFIKCEVEDGDYIYHCFGKLLSKESRQKTNDNIAWNLNIISPTKLRNCPDYQSIQMKRHNTLNKLGI